MDTHHIQHTVARKMVTEYITNDTQGEKLRMHYVQ